MDISGINKMYEHHVIKQKHKSKGRDKGYNDDTRIRNMKELLKVITNNPKITKANLFKALTFSTPTARKCINELLDAGKVKEYKVGRAKVLEVME